MKIKIILFLLFTTISMAQKPIQIVIDSIIYTDLNEQKSREFSIFYTIKNNSNNKVSFFLNTKSIFPSVESSLRYSPTYTLFQNDKEVQLSKIFTRKIATSNGLDSNNTIDEILNKSKDSLLIELEKYRKDSMYYQNKKNKALMQSVFNLHPNESKQYNQKLYWNKNRYIQNQDLEYYFNEQDHYFLRIELTLMKKEFSNILTPQQLELVLENPNFISGNYYSNKLEIYFKE
jgi:hypothetical protein